MAIKGHAEWSQQSQVTLVKRKGSISFEQWDSHMWSWIDVHGLFFGGEGIPERKTPLTCHEFVVPLEEEQDWDHDAGRLVT